MKRNTLAVLIGVAALGFFGCKSSHEHHDGMQPAAAKTQPAAAKTQPVAPKTGSAASRAAAIAVLSPTAGNKVQGKVFFVRETEGVNVVADITGLTPGKHGFHIHEKGDCSTPDAVSAGGHFNPEHSQHGGPTSPMRHAGDFGNITADANGVAHFQRVDSNLKLEGENSIIGKAVIVHANADDLTSQPAGNAGPRVACGVIEKQ